MTMMKQAQAAVVVAPAENLHLDENLTIDAAGDVRCRHCGTAVGTREGPYLEHALARQCAPSQAGPQIRGEAAQFVEEPVVMRQRLCPGCYVALLTEIVPTAEPAYRTKHIARLAPELKG